MSERLSELRQIAEETGVVDTTGVGINHQLISSFYETLSDVAGRIQPDSSSFGAAQRILGVIEKGGSPEEISMDDVGVVFQAAGGTFERIVIK